MGGERIEIRPYREGDAEEVFAAVRESLDDLMPWLGFAHADYAIEETRAWVEQCVRAFDERTEYHFNIRDASDRFLGGCGLNHIQTLHQTANLGYWVRSSARGRGIAGSAVARLQEFAFRHTDLVRLEIVCAVGNRASQRVAEKFGALREAVLRDRLSTPSGPTDAVMFALLRSGRHREPPA